MFKGCATALVTPMSEDGKEINYESFKKLIDFQVENGVSALLFLGTTGEPPTLTSDEKEDIIRFAVSYVNHRCPVIAGSGGNCTSVVIETCKKYEKLGVDGLLIVTPYYNKCTQAGLISHYTEIAKSVDLPIILYNVPSRTGVNMLPITINKLSTIKNIVGVKEASGNIEQLMENVRLSAGKDFRIYTGDDSLILCALLVGASGVISVTSNILPKEISELCEKCFSADVIKAQELAYKISTITKLMFCEVNPIPVKNALNLLGFNVGGLRLPLTNISPENGETIKKELFRLNKIKIY